MAITAALVKDLRERSGAGMMDAKKALTETDGDMDAAMDWLRTKGAGEGGEKIGPHCCRRAGGLGHKWRQRGGG